MKKILASILSVGILASMMAMSVGAVTTDNSLIYYSVNSNNVVNKTKFTPDASNLPGYSVKLALGISGLMFTSKTDSIATTKVTKGSSVATASTIYDKNVGSTGNWVLKVLIKDLAQVKSYPITVETVVKYTDPTTKNITEYASALNFTLDDSLVITGEDVISAHNKDENADPGPHIVDYVDNRYIVSKEAFIEANRDGRKIEYDFRDANDYAYSVEFKRPRNQTVPVNFKATRQAINNITEDKADNAFAFIKFYDANKTVLADEATVKVKLADFGNSKLWKNGGQVQVYEYDGDKLVKTDTTGTFDGTNQLLSFNTKTLGTFVLAANPVSDAVSASGAATSSAAIIEAPVVSAPVVTDNTAVTSEDINAINAANAGKAIPATGSADVLALAVTLAVITLGSASFVVYRKSKGNA